MGLQDDSARNPSRPSPNSSNFSSIQTISLRERAHRWSALTCPTPVQSRDFFHSSYDRAHFLDSKKARGHRPRLQCLGILYSHYAKCQLRLFSTVVPFEHGRRSSRRENCFSCANEGQTGPILE